jgi:hypothetical protein
MRAQLALVFTLGATAAASPETAEDMAVWKQLKPAMLAFQAGGSRDAFRDTCNQLRHAHPHSRYAPEVSSLWNALDNETRVPAPTLPPTATADEAASYWIYELRDVAGHQMSDPGEPDLFAAEHGRPPNAADQLVALGPASIPRLIAALDDDTPTRTIAWQRSFYSEYFVLRRRDVALQVLEHITGARFYNEGSTHMHLYMDTRERQDAVRANVTAWWQHSRGVAQAQMIENQLALMHANSTLGVPERVQMLLLLGEIEGPESVLPELRRLYAVDTTGLNSVIADALAELDPYTPVRAVFARFRADQSRDGDYTTLYTYGDARVYAEIARRYARTGKLDPGPWNLSEQARVAAQDGQGWAIPILARMLLDTKMTGSRYRGSAAQSFSAADDAVEQLAKLTGVDFGYHPDASEADRLAAIGNARQWWEHGGEAAVRSKIEAPHAIPVGDLLRSDDELAATARAIDDPRTRAGTVAHLGATHSSIVQRALVRALAGSHDEAERRAILAALPPTLWVLPAITDVLARPGRRADARARREPYVRRRPREPAARAHRAPRRRPRARAFRGDRRARAGQRA